MSSLDKIRQKFVDPKLFSKGGEHPHEKVLYLSVLKRFVLLRVRMKISYMAILRSLTIKELFLEAILQSYKQFLAMNLTVPKFTGLERKFFI